MTRYSFPHGRNSLRKLRDSLEFSQFLCARVVCVVEILPASRRILTDNLPSSLGCGIDRNLSPCRRNLKIVNPIQISFRETAAHGFIAKSSFRIAEATDADVLQTFDVCHWYRNGF